MWDTTIISLIGLLLLAFWIAFEFYRSHRAFRDRERLYLSISARIQEGKAVSPQEYAGLLPEDQEALRALQRSKKTLSASNPLCPMPASPAREEVVVHREAASGPPKNHTAAAGRRG